MDKILSFIMYGVELEDKEGLTLTQRLHYAISFPLALSLLLIIISAFVLYFLLGIFVLDGLLWLITGKSLAGAVKNQK